MEVVGDTMRPVDVGAATGFEDFYQEVYRRVAATLALAWSDREAALEATNEAFVRAFRSWERVSRMRSPDGWVYRVALNQARRQHHRDDRRRTAEQRHAAATTSLAPAGTSLAEFGQLVTPLSERQRIAVTLRYVADLKEKDIAQVMGIRRGTVATLLSQAHERLRMAEGSDQAGEGSNR